MALMSSLMNDKEGSSGKKSGGSGSASDKKGPKVNVRVGNVKTDGGINNDSNNEKKMILLLV